MINIQFPVGRTDIARAVATMLNTVADTADCGHATPDSNLVDSVKSAEHAASIEDITQAEVNAGNLKTRDEYEQAAIDAILLADDLAEVSNDDAETYGINLRMVYEQTGGTLASLETAAEILAEGDPEMVLGNTGLILEALTQTLATTANDAEVDEKGVAKDDKYCATAAKPFYGSGKRKGQWKKRGGAAGVTEEEYDAWYATQLATTTPTTAEPEEKQFDTSNAFGASTNEPPKENPKNVNELMVWISERQAAGHLTQEQVTDAYAANEVTDIMALFSMPGIAQAVVVRGILTALGCE